MADSIRILLQTAVFRGIAFKFIAHREKGGRKSINYEYPNQDKRFVQDLGKFPRIWNMDCYINSQEIDYFVFRNLFVNALEKPGIGILIHPFVGAVNVFAKPYDLSEGINELGYAVFRVSFYETDTAVFPSIEDSFKEGIVGQFTNYVESLNGNFESKWSVSGNSFNNSSYAVNNLIAPVISSFAVLPVLASSGTTKQQADFNNSLNTFNDNKETNIFNSSDLASGMEDLFDKAGNLSSVLDERISAMESLFNFNASVPIISTTTIEDERELNRQTINQYINTMALYFDYIFIASKDDFATEDEIENESNILNDQFELIVLNNTYTNVVGNKFEILSTDTFSILQNARTKAHNYLNSLVVDSKKIIDITIPRNGLLSLTYSYYTSLANLNILYDLNKLNNAANISGPFKVITDENADIT